MTDYASYGVGIVGAGTIVEFAHVPAYRQLGINVHVIYDQVAARAEAIAALCPGARTASTLEEVLTDPRIDLVDIAITPSAQTDVARRVIEAGKHLLCQKPLAPTLAQARALVSLASESGVKLAVNQQMRWEPAIAAVNLVLATGSMGRPVACAVHTNLPVTFSPDHWLGKEKRLAAMFGTIHLLDAARFLLGEPAYVTARLPDTPRAVPGETWANVWLEWDDHSFMSIFDRYENHAGDTVASMRIDGTNGAIRARFGMWDDYPHSGPDFVEQCAYGSAQWEVISDKRSWLPDAFVGPVTGVLEAIARDSTPPTSGEDHLSTLRLVEAVYLSSQEQRTVRPDEMEA